MDLLLAGVLLFLCHLSAPSQAQAPAGVPVPLDFGVPLPNVRVAMAEAPPDPAPAGTDIAFTPLEPGSRPPPPEIIFAGSALTSGSGASDGPVEPNTMPTRAAVGVKVKVAPLESPASSQGQDTGIIIAAPAEQPAASATQDQVPVDSPSSMSSSGLAVPIGQLNFESLGNQAERASIQSPPFIVSPDQLPVAKPKPTADSSTGPVVSLVDDASASSSTGGASLTQPDTLPFSVGGEIQTGTASGEVVAQVEQSVVDPSPTVETVPDVLKQSKTKPDVQSSGKMAADNMAAVEATVVTPLELFDSNLYKVDSSVAPAGVSTSSDTPTKNTMVPGEIGQQMTEAASTAGVSDVSVSTVGSPAETGPAGAPQFIAPPEINPSLGLAIDMPMDIGAAGVVIDTGAQSVPDTGTPQVALDAPLPTEAAVDAPLPTEAAVDAPLPTEAAVDALLPTEATGVSQSSEITAAKEASIGKETLASIPEAPLTIVASSSAVPLIPLPPVKQDPVPTLFEASGLSDIPLPSTADVGPVATSGEMAPPAIQGAITSSVDAGVQTMNAGKTTAGATVAGVPVEWESAASDRFAVPSGGTGSSSVAYLPPGSNVDPTGSLGEGSTVPGSKPRPGDAANVSPADTTNPGQASLSQTDSFSNPNTLDVQPPYRHFGHLGLKPASTVNYPQRIKIDGNLQRLIDWSNMIVGPRKTAKKMPSVSSTGTTLAIPGPRLWEAVPLTPGTSGIAVDMTNNLPPPYDGFAGDQASAGLQVAFPSPGQSEGVPMTQDQPFNANLFEPSVATNMNLRGPDNMFPVPGERVAIPMTQEQPIDVSMFKPSVLANVKFGTPMGANIPIDTAQPRAADKAPVVDFMTAFLDQSLDKLEGKPMPGFSGGSAGINIQAQPLQGNQPPQAFGAIETVSLGEPSTVTGGIRDPSLRTGGFMVDKPFFETKQLVSLPSDPMATGLGGITAGTTGGDSGMAAKKRELSRLQWQRIVGLVLEKKKRESANKINEAAPAASNTGINNLLKVDFRQPTANKMTKNVLGAVEVKPLDGTGVGIALPLSSATGFTQAGAGTEPGLPAMEKAALAVENASKSDPRAKRLVHLARLLLQKARERLVTKNELPGQSPSSVVQRTFFSAPGTGTGVGFNPANVATDSMTSLTGSGSIDISPLEGSPLTMGTPAGNIDSGFGASFNFQGSAGTSSSVVGASPTGSTGYAQPEVCTYVKDNTDPIYFLEIDGEAVHRRRCPLGTWFSPENCRCSNIVNVIGDCLEVQLDFNKGIVEDKAANHLPIFNENVEVTNRSTPYPGIAVFLGDGKLKVWRYQYYDFRDHVMLTLRFRPAGFGNDPHQSLISNCDSGEEPSIGITYDVTTKQLSMLLRPVNKTTTFLAFDVNPDAWNDVTYMYNGQSFTGIVNNKTKSTPVEGNIEITDAPITLGYCHTYGYFNGAMDDVNLYRCIP